MQQEFRFDYRDPQQLRALLESLGSNARLDRREDEFFVFTAPDGDPEFSFDVEIIPQGFRSIRSGSYFGFLGLFVEAVTGTFGPVTIEDA
jgi:hypothetical protein